MLAQNIDLQRPPDWVLEANDGKVRCFSPDRKSLVSIEPVASIGDAQTVMKKLLASKRVGPVDAPSNVRMKGDVGQIEVEFNGSLAGAPVQARAMLAIRGQAGTLYVAASPPSQFAQRLPQMVEMLKSFRFRSNSYQRRVEGREQSFSTEFPSSWRTELGLFRMGAFDNRVEASAVGPNATVFVGDRNLGNYLVPDQTMASFGLREGSTYSATGASSMILLRYLPGSQAGLYWLNLRLRGAKVLGQRERPDIAQQMSAQRYRYGNPMRAMLHAGEVAFEYQGQRGQVFVATEVYSNAAMTNWSVASIYGYFAKPEGEAEAREAVGHALASWKVNAQWLAMDRKFQAVDAENAVRTMQEISALHSRTFESSDKIARVRGDLLSGSFRVVDPTTGETATVKATSNYYYRVIDPNSPPVEVNLQRLLRVDWDTK